MYKIIKILINSGLDPDLIDGYNRTALYYAVSDYSINDNQLIIQTLLNSGCDSLNIYESKKVNYSHYMSLKHICRTFLYKNNLIENIRNNVLPKELYFYCNKKLINF